MSLAFLNFNSSPTVTLITSGDAVRYDVRQGDFRRTLRLWQEKYKVVFPDEGDSFVEFYQLFKEYLH